MATVAADAIPYSPFSKYATAILWFPVLPRIYVL